MRNRTSEMKTCSLAREILLRVSGSLFKYKNRNSDPAAREQGRLRLSTLPIRSSLRLRDLSA